MQAYEDSQVDRARATSADSDATIEVVCEDCRKQATFPATDRGKIRQCPHCRNYVDVEEEDAEDAFWQLDDEE